MKLKYYLAYYSFLIVKVIFGLSFISIVILHYYIFDKTPTVILCLFFLVLGIFVGYSGAYYSIKYLKKQDHNHNG